ncbi:MAG TPA: 5-(carboxyamino)imidazole ribonucleotide mutase [Chloroflexi bacterium]|nr:5-(carboxyamino)imidazole ribonucleotide mutase [Chloroflexota bacterium]
MSAQVAIVMGSASDGPIMAIAEETLKGLGIEHETRVLSAHRTPDEVREWARGLADRGVKVVIAAAGGAAHLAGAVAAHQTLPVIGVPLASANAIAGGLDALLSTVQMPRGVPVATVAIGEAGGGAGAPPAAPPPPLPRKRGRP